MPMIPHPVLLARAGAVHTLGSLGELATEWVESLSMGDVFDGPEAAAVDHGFAYGTAEHTVFVHIARSVIRGTIVLSLERGTNRILSIADKGEPDHLVHAVGKCYRKAA
jgi:hypothetical protein